jgi:hypothetical protein
MSIANDALMLTHGIGIQRLLETLQGARAQGNLIGPSMAVEALGTPLPPQFGDVRIALDPSVLTRPNVRTYAADAFTPRVPLNPLFGEGLARPVDYALPNTPQWQRFAQQTNEPNLVAANPTIYLQDFWRSAEGRELGQIIRGLRQPQSVPEQAFFNRHTPQDEIADMFASGIRNAEDMPTVLDDGTLRAGLAREVTGHPDIGNVLRGQLLSDPSTVPVDNVEAASRQFRMLNRQQAPEAIQLIDDVESALIYGGNPQTITDQFYNAFAPGGPAPYGRDLPEAGINTAMEMLGVLASSRTPEASAAYDALVRHMNSGRAGYAEAKAVDYLPLDQVARALVLPTNPAVGDAAAAAEAQRLFQEVGTNLPIVGRNDPALGRWTFGGAAAAGAGAAGSAEAAEPEPHFLRVDGGMPEPQDTAMNQMARRVRRAGPRATPEELVEAARTQAAETAEAAAQMPGGLPALGAYRMADLATPFPAIGRLLGYSPDVGMDPSLVGDALTAGLFGVGAAVPGVRALRNMRLPSPTAEDAAAALIR